MQEKRERHKRRKEGKGSSQGVASSHCPAGKENESHTKDKRERQKILEKEEDAGKGPRSRKASTLREKCKGEDLEDTGKSYKCKASKMRKMNKNLRIKRNK